MFPSEIVPIFTEDEDEMIVDFQKARFPITVPKLRVLAWQYDHINGINAFTNNIDQKVGQIWAKFFLSITLIFMCTEP